MAGAASGATTLALSTSLQFGFDGQQRGGMLSGNGMTKLLAVEEIVSECRVTIHLTDDP